MILVIPVVLVVPFLYMLSAQEYKSLLTEVIQKQMIALGPAITLAKVRKIKGITVDDNGRATDIKDTPQEITKQLNIEFKELSEEIARITMKPLLLRDEAPATQLGTPAPQPETPTTEEAKTETKL